MKRAEYSEKAACQSDGLVCAVLCVEFHDECDGC